MRHRNEKADQVPGESAQDVLTEVLRDGAQRMLTEAIEAEVADWIEARGCA